MSDSDDFGGIEPTTPNVPRRRPPTSNGTAAGPSRVAATKKRKADPIIVVQSEEDEVLEVGEQRRSTGNGTTKEKRRRKEEPPEVEDDPDDIYATEEENSPGRSKRVRDSEEVQVVDESPKRTRGGSRKPSSRATSAMANGKSATLPSGAAAKGKAKAQPGHSTKASSSRQRQEEPMDVDTIEVDFDETDGPLLASKINEAAQSGPGRASGVRPTPRSRPAQKDEECEKLKEQLRRANAHIEDLRHQLDEVMKVRKTEAELLLERTEAQHAAERQAHEAVLKDVMEQLERKDPLLRTGTRSVFEILTREEADKENKGLRDQLRSYKEVLGQRDQHLKERDEEITILKAAQNDLRYELQLEVERAKGLVEKVKQPGSASRPRAGVGVGDPKYGTLVKFYEDLTNVLITNMRVLPGRYLNTDDYSMTCIYSYRDVVDKTVPTKSLNFTLRLCYDLAPNVKGEPRNIQDDLVESVHYTPLSLEKESDDFVEGLGFLKGNFTFERDQLALFMRTLHDTVSGEGKPEEGESDDDVQVIE